MAPASTQATQTETQPIEQPSLPPPPKEGKKLYSISFAHPVTFESNSSVALGPRCLSLQPAVLTHDGQAVPCDKNQRPDGILIRRLHGQMGAARVERFFVPMASIASLGFSE